MIKLHFDKFFHARVYKCVYSLKNSSKKNLEIMLLAPYRYILTLVFF